MSEKPKNRSERRAAERKIKGGASPTPRQMPVGYMDAQTRKSLRRMYGGR